MKKKRIYLFFIYLVSIYCSLSRADVISIPDNCFKNEISPCLLKSYSDEKLVSKDKKYSYMLRSGSIAKWNQFNEKPSVEVIEGLLVANSEVPENEFIINNVKIQSQQAFINKNENALKILNMDNFMLSEFIMSDGKKIESVLSKSDFLTKKDLVIFLSVFMPQKSKLVAYLKKIEPRWQNEFKIQTETQTKVIQRAIASEENQEKLNKQKKQQELEELKKVRETFFYRTFYR